MAFSVKTYMLGPLGTNAYLVTCETSGESAIVDPGGISDELMRDIAGSDLKTILLTHGHFDHIEGVDEVAAATGARVLIHGHDLSMLGDATANGAFMMGAVVTVGTPAETVNDGDTITIGESTLTVIHTPGHTPGCVTYHAPGIALAGDLLFRMSVGRWDLPGGDFHTLSRSLRTLTGRLDHDTVVYPGHGETTTIGFELANNPFLND